MSAGITIAREERIATIKHMFDRLSDRDALKLFSELSDRWDESYGHGDIVCGIEYIAQEIADEEGWQETPGVPLSESYLERARR